MGCPALKKKNTSFFAILYTKMAGFKPRPVLLGVLGGNPNCLDILIFFPTQKKSTQKKKLAASFGFKKGSEASFLG